MVHYRVIFRLFTTVNGMISLTKPGPLIVWSSCYANCATTAAKLFRKVYAPIFSLVVILPQSTEKLRINGPQSVWPDLAIYGILGKFLKPLATINYAKSPTFLGNFCKSVKIYLFSSEIILGNFYRHLAIFIWSHWPQSISGGLSGMYSNCHNWRTRYKESKFVKEDPTSNFIEYSTQLEPYIRP